MHYIYQTLPSPRAILKAIRAGVGWVWDRDYAQQTSSAGDHTASGSRIVCHGLVGITFRNISHVTVYGLTLISCGKGAVGHSDYYTDHDYQTNYGMSIHLGQYIRILNCLFQDSIGTALGVSKSSLVLKGSNSFTNNCWACSDRNRTCICLGGAIHTYASTLIFEAENSTFISNSAEDGGGIYSCHSTLNFTGRSTFRNNSADKYNGGGIRASDSSLKFTGNTTFQSNSAKRHGGGFGAIYSTLNFIGNTTFSDNSAIRGGSVYNWFNAISTWLLNENSIPAMLFHCVTKMKIEN